MKEKTKIKRVNDERMNDSERKRMRTEQCDQQACYWIHIIQGDFYFEKSIRQSFNLCFLLGTFILKGDHRGRRQDAAEGLLHWSEIRARELVTALLTGWSQHQEVQTAASFTEKVWNVWLLWSDAGRIPQVSSGGVSSGLILSSGLLNIKFPLQIIFI